VRKSILSAIAALSLCLCMPAMAQTLMRTTPRQSAKTARIKVSEDRIREVQQALEGKGYDVGKIDGEFGSKTERALRKFQKAQRLPVTGQIDRATLARLRDQIRAVQRALRRKGYDIKTIDGTFGEKTERALRKFQKAQNLPVTGLLDDRSLTALQIGKRGAAGRGAPARAKRSQKKRPK
jgi:peptidoglycan endopeptidase LytE